MGLLQDGQWVDKWYDTKKTGGRFVRTTAQFRNWVTATGAPGPSGVGGFKAESGRYHLYVSHACPWAHRTIIFRAIKRLEPHISLSVVHWHMADKGWTFAPADGVIPDTVKGAEFMYQIYTAADPAKNSCKELHRLPNSDHQNGSSGTNNNTQYGQNSLLARHKQYSWPAATTLCFF